ncbi:DNA-binding HxlR family transcriptional regulator [Thermocatellispora tengchongensis]|uniref:DNA-binding HxlR family transcriptional regulator n=1 Tax=Thermocatellispora tengchongensis TaxID=1073253 RepID=A0A840P1L1_9ACTN|nr:helix-turn-helix domain-containing protein [Thermocatellispora tengchongensis]MBB5135154.1 DNA-binding HxlR family transcriptional regulator [Thermocatellispora tengchongensis]
MGLGKNYEGQDCSVARSLELVGERWTLLVIRDAIYGVRRFGDFLAHLDAPRAVLAQRLTTLVEAGVLERRRYQDAPPRDEYVLTPMGRELWPVVYLLGRWGERHLSARSRRRFFHMPCDAGLDGNAACTECGAIPELEDIEVRPGPAADHRRTDPVSVALRAPHRLLQPLP